MATVNDTLYMTIEQYRIEVQRVPATQVQKFISEKVGGFFDIVRLDNYTSGYVNDEGLLNNLWRNTIATQIVYGSNRAMAVIDPNAPEWIIQTYEGPLYIAGPMVVVGLDRSSGEDIDCPGRWIATAISMLGRMDGPN